MLLSVDFDIVSLWPEDVVRGEEANGCLEQGLNEISLPEVLSPSLCLPNSSRSTQTRLHALLRHGIYFKRGYGSGRLRPMLSG